MSEECRIVTVRPTSLNELEPCIDAALVGDEKKTSAMFRSLLLFLSSGDFRTECNASAHDSVVVDIDSKFFQIRTRVRLANVGGERTEFLEVPFRREVEIISPAVCEQQLASFHGLRLPQDVVGQIWVVEEWGQVNGCSCETMSASRFVG